MRRCEDCKIILDDDVRHCPKCGRDLSASTSAPRTAWSDVTPLLTSANLHKIRAEWDEAIADCTEALRADPRNPDIASLLGGIYEERGMLDEALVWYQMALELNPSNAQDQDRLDRVAKALHTKLESKGSESFRTFERRTKIWAAALGAVFLVIVLVAIITTLMRNKSMESTTGRPTATRQAQGYSPSINRPGAQSYGAPKAAPAKPASSESDGSSLRTPAETYIRSELASADEVTQAGATVDDVTADPRSGVVSVTFAIPFKGFITKEQVLRAAAPVARKTFGLNRDVQFVTVRCLLQTGGAQGTQIAFVGDIARQSVEAMGSSVTADQLASAFTRPWWNPQIK